MALRSPTEFHNYWGNGFAAYAQLPNVAGSPTQNSNLQTGDIAYVPGDGLYVNVLATLGAAVWTLSNVPVGTGIATISTARIDLYVSDINGNDANDGLTPLTALKTLTAAFAPGRNPNILAFDLVVHVGAHAGAGYTWATIDSYSLVDGASIYVYGDGAGQAGEDGFTVLVATVASAAGTTDAIVKSTAALGVNAYRGKTIEMVTGAAAGNRRTINYNTATDIVPSVLFDVGVAPGDTYRIVESAVVIDLADYPLTPTVLASGIGAPRGYFEQLADYGQPSGLYLVNLKTLIAFGFVRAQNSAVFCLGVELGAGGFAVVVVDDGEIGFGETSTEDAYATALVASPSAWHGWGLFAGDFLYWDGGDAFYHGMVVGSQLLCNGTQLGHLRGGNMAGIAAQPTIAVLFGSEQAGSCVLEIGPTRTTGRINPLRITALGVNAEYGGSACVRCSGPTSSVKFSLLQAPSGVVMTSDTEILAADSQASIVSTHGFDTGIEVHAGTFGVIATSGGTIGLTHDWITAFTANPAPSGDCTVNRINGRPATAAAMSITNRSAYASATGSRIYRQ